MMKRSSNNSFGMDNLDKEWNSHFPNSGVVVVTSNGHSLEGFEFGIDLTSYPVSSSFCGFISVPFGLHMVSFGSHFAPRIGMFISLNSENSVIALGWASDIDSFVISDLSSETKAEMKGAVLTSLRHKLFAYPQNQYQTWLNLISHLDQKVLEKCGLILAAPFISQEHNSEEKASVSCGTFSVPSFISLDTFEQRIIERKFSDLTPEKLTQLKLDKSWLVETLTTTTDNSGDLLGQFQLSFLLFLLVFSFPALQFWKGFLTTIATCSNYLQSNGSFTKEFLLTLFHQLNFLSADLLQNDISEETFLAPTLAALLSSLHQVSDLDTRATIERLTSYLHRRFNFTTMSVDSTNDIVFVDASNLPEPISNESYPIDIRYLDIPADKERQSELKFSWRYPLLYREQQKSEGREDFLMTAVRVLDEFEEDNPLRIEAVSFVMNESKFI